MGSGSIIGAEYDFKLLAGNVKSGQKLANPSQSFAVKTWGL
jgi:hypothetical protein